MFLGAGSVMHGMNDQVDMRRFGGSAHRHEGHLGDLRRSAGWPSSAFPRSSGFWSKDKIIEAAFDGDGWRPWVFGVRRADRRGHHRLLHDPAVPDDLPRRSAGGPTTCTRTSRPTVMTVPVDGARARLGAPRAACSARPTRSSGLARPGRRRARPRSPRARRPGAAHRLTLLARRRRRRAGLPDVRQRDAVPETAPAGSPLTRGRPPRPLPGRVQRGRCSCAPASTSPASSSSSTTGCVDGAVNGLAAADRRHVRPVPAAADRVRPLLRPVDVRRGRPASSAPCCW